MWLTCCPVPMRVLPEGRAPVATPANTLQYVAKSSQVANSVFRQFLPNRPQSAVVSGFADRPSAQMLTQPEVCMVQC